MILIEWSDYMFLIRVCGVDLFSTDNVLEFITELKKYQLKFGIEQVEAVCINEVSPAVSIPKEITINVIISFKDL